jgi:F0F1-type ATP synthase assembly protein I
MILRRLLALDLADARGMAYRFALAQACITAVVSVACLLLGGWRAGVSALLGGGISTLGSLAMAAVAFRRAFATHGVLMLAALLIGETVKLFVVIVLFVLVLTLMKVAPGPMFSAYVATFLVYLAVFATQSHGTQRLSGREMR